MDSAAALIKRARLHAGMSQARLAANAGITQSVVSAYESGKREPSFATLDRLVRAAGAELHPVIQPHATADNGTVDNGTVDVGTVENGTVDVAAVLERHRDHLRETLHSLGADNIRVFGSVARSEERAGSDVDLLVDLRDGVGLFALARMRGEAERILGISADVVPTDGLKDAVAATALAEAVPL